MREVGMLDQFAAAWLGGFLILGVIATIAFRQWLANEMRQRRIDRGSPIFLLSNLPEWKYLGRLRSATDDPDAERYRKRALRLYVIFGGFTLTGFVVLLLMLLAGAPTSG